MEQMNSTRKVYDIEKIFEIVLAFNSVNDRATLLDIILTKMMEITDSDAGTLYTLEDGQLHFQIIRNNTFGIFQTYENDDIKLPPITLDESNIQNVSAYSAIKNEIVLVDDVYAENERFNLQGPKDYDKITGYYTQAMLVLPMCTQRGSDEEVLGVIQLINPIDPVSAELGVYGNIFEPPIVPALAKVAANTLSNLIYVKELRLLFRSFAAALTKAIDERSPYNNNHTNNVARFSERFVQHLGRMFPPGHKYHFDKQHIESVVLAVLLHDIGKIFTPLSIMDKSCRLGEKVELVNYRFELKKAQIEIDWLNKRVSEEEYNVEKTKINEAHEFVNFVNSTGFLQDDDFERVQTLRQLTYKNAEGEIIPLLNDSDMEDLSVRKGTLTGSEREIMNQHVSITGRIIENIPFWKYYGDVPKWAKSHHEFLDGSGYPDGLKGNEIPMEACIITIMDIFDALIASDRPYKKAMPIERALGILTEMADEGKLHKELVQLFSESQLWEDM